MLFTDWQAILQPLIEKYKDYKHPLHFKNPYQLIIMVILSHQDSKPNINIISTMLSEKNIFQHLSNASLVIDTTDNWRSMVLINEYCVKNSIPLLSCSVIGYDGQIILFKNKKRRHLCLNCIYLNQNEPNLPRCDTIGVLGTAAGLTGLNAAQLTINFFTNNHENIEKLIMINSKSMKIDHIKIKENNNCIYKKY